MGDFLEPCEYIISIHAPHARSDHNPCSCHTFCIISIHAPHARSDPTLTNHATFGHISIHAPHARSALTHTPFFIRLSHFNPRSSCEERLEILPRSCALPRFQSTLLMRGATGCFYLFYSTQKISIHAPHARSDTRDALIVPVVITFQSTLLMRGATVYRKIAV